MNKEPEAIEIFGNADQPSRSGSFISPETFIKCLKDSAPVPVPVTVKGEEIGHIVVMRNATAEENEGINNYIKSISEPLYTKNDMIERLEKVKEEMHNMLESDVVQGDHWCTLIKNKAHLFISVVEKNIDELKRSNK